MDSPGVAAPPPSPVGKYGPLVHLSRFDLAPEELTWQLPVNGELYRLMPGSDRPDYSLMVLRRPLHFYPPEGFDQGRVEPEQQVPDRKGRPMVRVHALLVCARFVGQQLHSRMVDLPVNVAFVIDNSLARDERVDFAKIEYAGVGFLSEGHAERRPPTVPPPATAEAGQAAASEGASAPPAPPASPPPPVPENPQGAEPATDEPAPAPGTDVAREAATILRRGIEERRGSPVSRLSAKFSLGDGHRVTGLTGNADGEPPEPTVETFARLNEVFARFGDHPATADVRGVRIRIGQDTEDVELARG
ncbi:hypothetical protein [Intrasporangium sp.]|uniref:hypothetical protein n=1 Tax=Intrasporangium sp. TaxID=1925024 RepID=UPI00293AD18B|nr:hypothetical protein [Intrasporangium sp.]MDV3220566.1 hypothetical protein [Intrasporangium sp.]